MDTLTHSLLGLTASKAGLEKLSPGATLCCIVAANAPDIDFIAVFFGDRWTLLRYHRGVTHAIVGTLALTLLVPLVLWLGDWLRAIVRHRARVVSFRGLLLASLILSVSHPVMDWTNNYGVRPFLPWNDRWFYGDLVFIVDPFLWVILGATAFLLTSKAKWQLVIWSVVGIVITSFVLVGIYSARAVDHPVIVSGLWLTIVAAAVLARVIGYFQPGHRNLALGLAAFTLVAAYWVSLGVLHGQALRRIQEAGVALAAERSERVTQIAGMPTLANPVHWRGLIESDRAIYRFDLFLSDPAAEIKNLTRFAKPEGIEALAIDSAKQDRRVKILLEFSRFPLGRLASRDCLTETLVQFADLRYTEPGRRQGNFSVEVPVECPRQR
jgi:inner membrane protein